MNSTVSVLIHNWKKISKKIQSELLTFAISRTGVTLITDSRNAIENLYSEYKTIFTRFNAFLEGTNTDDSLKEKEEGIKEFDALTSKVNSATGKADNILRLLNSDSMSRRSGSSVDRRSVRSQHKVSLTRLRFAEEAAELKLKEAQ